jgi:branched-chain amino acid transport system substrate-binding protein
MRTGRCLRLIAPLAIAAIAAAACGSSSSGGNGGGGGGGKTYTIGFQGPLSGGNAQLGINERDGVELAVQQANATGNLGFTLKVEASDDQGSADGSPPAAQKLIGDSNVVAVVGPSFSGASLAAGKLYSSAHLLMVTPSATEPDITDHGFTAFYRAVADDNAQGPPDAKYLVNTVHAKKIYLLDDTTDYGVGLAKAFKTEATTLGATTVGNNEAPQTSTCVQGATGSTSQYPTVASKIKSSGADAVFYAGYYCDFGLLAKQLRSVGYTGQLMSGDGSDDTRYITGAGQAAAQGTLLSCQCSDIASNPKGTSFISAYKAKFGAAPGAYSAEAFDVANAVIGVMKAGSTDRQSILTAFANVDYHGLTKEIVFGPDHNLKTQAAFLYQVKGAALKYLGNLLTLTK